MNRKMQLLVVLTVGIGYVGAAQAYSHKWGSLEDALKCQSEVEASTPGWDSKHYDNKYMSNAVESGKLSPRPCKARQRSANQARSTICLRLDPEMKSDLEYADKHKISHEDYCNDAVGGNLWQLVYNDHQTKASQAEEARKKDEAKAKAAAAVAAAELPKPLTHDAKLEKMDADAYHRDYPEGSVLRVILGQWAEDLEKDAFGRVTGRDLNATVVNKQADGRCMMHDELWMQHGNGRALRLGASAVGAVANRRLARSTNQERSYAPRSPKPVRASRCFGRPRMASEVNSARPPPASTPPPAIRRHRHRHRQLPRRAPQAPRATPPRTC